MTNMKLSHDGLAEVMAHEGIVPYRYRDSVGVDTFGVGHTARAGAPDPAKMMFAKEHPLPEVITVFRGDVLKFEKRVRSAIRVPVAQHAFDAAVSFDFNTGAVHRATWIKSLNGGHRERAAKEIMNWRKPPEVRGRRKKEQKLFRDGIYSAVGRASVYPADSVGQVQWARGKEIDVRPAISLIQGANAEDRAAEAAGRRAGGTAAGGGAAGGGSQFPDLPLDGGLIRLALVGLALGLLLTAAFYGLNWYRRRRAAQRTSDRAAAEIEKQLKG